MRINRKVARSEGAEDAKKKREKRFKKDYSTLNTHFS